jgi:hypothetical protein
MLEHFIVFELALIAAFVELASAAVNELFVIAAETSVIDIEL